MHYYLEHESPLGPLLLAATEHGLSGLYFEQHRHFKGTDGWQRAADQLHLRRAARQLDEYFGGQRTEFELELDLHGTPFQRAVWQQLMTLPFGHTTTYARHAQAMGNPKALRAVGAAIGRNPVSIIVPCHRVIGTNGAPTGYAGGIERKCRLLALEGIALL